MFVRIAKVFEAVLLYTFLLIIKSEEKKGWMCAIEFCFVLLVYCFAEFLLFIVNVVWQEILFCNFLNEIEGVNILSLMFMVLIFFQDICKPVCWFGDFAYWSVSSTSFKFVVLVAFWCMMHVASMTCRGTWHFWRAKMSHLNHFLSLVFAGLPLTLYIDLLFLFSSADALFYFFQIRWCGSDFRAWFSIFNCIFREVPVDVVSEQFRVVITSCNFHVFWCVLSMILLHTTPVTLKMLILTW